MSRGDRPSSGSMSRPQSRLVAYTLGVFSLMLHIVAFGEGSPGAVSPGGDWQFPGGNEKAQFYSPLNSINQNNVGDLGLAWFVDLPMKDSPVGTPIIAHGMIYLAGSRDMAYALDVRTGELRWKFDPANEFSGAFVKGWGARVVRGLGYGEGKIVIKTADCRIVAVDAISGEKVWDSRVCNDEESTTLTSAPRVAGGKVFVGSANADLGTARGHVTAFDLASGKRLWRFYTVPGHPSDKDRPAMQMAAKTWDPTFFAAGPKGGSPWEEVRYDPRNNLVYIGVGGPQPWNPKARGPKRGDELFTNSIVAVNADTGEYAWHYLTTPEDMMNYDAVMPMVLADLEIKGKLHSVVMQAPKNGYFYVLDTDTGKPVNLPSNIVRVNWSKGIDPETFRPIPNPEVAYWERSGDIKIFPSSLGAHNYQPMSYSPKSGLVYIPALDLAAKIKAGRKLDDLYAEFIDLSAYLEEARFPLVAWDPVEQKEVWSTGGVAGMGGGVLSTAGNLVFQGTQDGMLRAYHAEDGREQWSQFVGAPVIPAPVTITVDGQQVLFAIAGTGMTSATNRGGGSGLLVPGADGPPRLLAFQIGGQAVLPPTPGVQPFTEPPYERPSSVLADQGEKLYVKYHCGECHAQSAGAAPGSVPDLRRSTAGMFQLWDGIIKGGLFKAVGMPQFESISDEELLALKAYVLQQAWVAYDAQEMDSSADQDGK